MRHFKLALLGFGNVGKALAFLLMEKQVELLERYGITYSVTGIATKSHGCAVDPHGIDLRLALEVDDVTPLSAWPISGDVYEFIQHCGANVLFENTPVDYRSGQPAVDYIRLGLETGMHAITANKGPVVYAYQQLTKLAKERGHRFYFESAVMDGAPIFSLFREALPGAQLISLTGILNSTTNLILTRMEEGESFEQALTYCQAIGITETDPSGDIEGWDASIKLAALVNVLMGVRFKPDEVERKGISEITPERIENARFKGKRWKLVCWARKGSMGVQARVAPELVGLESPLYGVMGTTSIVQFETDVLGLFSLVEKDPGPHTTAYGLLADFLNAVRE